MTVEEAVRSLLVSEPLVTELVGQRVYPTQAPNRATLPLVVYQEADQQSVMTYGGPKLIARYSMDLTCWAATYAEAKAVARQVKLRLNGHRGSADGVRILGIFDQTEADDSEIPQHGDERGLFGVSMSLMLWFREAAE